MTDLITSNAYRDGITVEVGSKHAKLLRSEILAGLSHVTNPGTCTTYALLRGLAFSQAELRQLLDEMGAR